MWFKAKRIVHELVNRFNELYVQPGLFLSVFTGTDLNLNQKFPPACIYLVNPANQLDWFSRFLQ
jgi:hypothetical protein